MLGMGGGGRKRGRPRSRWIDGIAEDTGMNVYQMVEAAKDRIIERDGDQLFRLSLGVAIDLTAQGDKVKC